MRRLARYPIARGAAMGAALACSAAAAADPVGDGWTAGVEAMALEHSYAIGDAELSATGDLAGAQVSYQRYPAFRAEAQLLAGGLESELGGHSASDPVSYGGAKFTWGVPLPDRMRLYGGAGAQYLHAELDEDGEETSTMVYLPVGVARAGLLRGGWRALTAFEVRVPVGGRHEIEWPSGESGEFDAFGGLGGELAVRFTHRDTPVQIEPYVSVLAAADLRSADFGGSDERVEAFTQSALGLRLAARF